MGGELQEKVLANMALDYLQLEEATGRAPTPKEFGNARFKQCAEAGFGTDVEEAWACYENSIRDTP